MANEKSWNGPVDAKVRKVTNWHFSIIFLIFFTTWLASAQYGKVHVSYRFMTKKINVILSYKLFMFFSFNFQKTTVTKNEFCSNY